jgi:hypothetical protein
MKTIYKMIIFEDGVWLIAIEHNQTLALPGPGPEDDW